MLAAILGCSAPFTLLFIIAVASFYLSNLIAADDALTSPAHNTQKLISNNKIKSNSLRKSFQTSYDNIFNSIKLKVINSPVSKNRDANFNFKHQSASFSDEASSIKVSKHYTIPPTSISVLRKRHGENKNIFGEWNTTRTRQFYRSNLPRSLQIDGALGLTLEERARLASESRFALRLYSRERSHFIVRWFSEVYDGLRHLKVFGYWSSSGMNWEEVKLKYFREAKNILGENVSELELEEFVYRKILERSCVTNETIDALAERGVDFKHLTKYFNLFVKPPPRDPMISKLLVPISMVMGYDFLSVSLMNPCL